MNFTFEHRGVSFFLKLIAVLTLFSSFARADVPAIDPQDSGSDYYQGSYSLGFAFTVNSSVTVNALGFYDAKKDGLKASHEVGIYDESCNLKASTTVSTSDPLTGSFRYVGINPLTLPPGKYYAAAVTNGSDPYLIFANNLKTDSRLSFGGFVIHSYGGSTSLACPNGPGADASVKGDFGPNFLIADSSGTVGPTPVPTPVKRATACKLFCNRTGIGGFTPDGLNTADCYVTVADKAGASGLIPSGVVKFAATDGFLPAAGVCPLTIDPRSASCNFKLSIPSVPPFPIGVRFPIGIEYTGDATFGTCADGHHLLIGTCIDTTDDDVEADCKSPVGLNSTKKPKIDTKGILNQLIECGGNKPTPTPANKQELCLVDGSYSTSLALALVGMTGENFLKLGAAITASDVKKFPALKFIRDAKNKYNAGELTLILSSLSDIEKLLKGKKTSIEAGGQATAGARSNNNRAQKVITTFSVGKLSAKVDVGTIVEKGVKVPSKTKQLFSILRRIGITEIPVTVKYKMKRTDVKGSKSGTDTFNVDL